MFLFIFEVVSFNKVIKYVYVYFFLFLFFCIIKIKLMEYMEYKLVKKLMEYKNIMLMGLIRCWYEVML